MWKMEDDGVLSESCSVPGNRNPASLSRLCMGRELSMQLAIDRVYGSHALLDLSQIAGGLQPDYLLHFCFITVIHHVCREPQNTSSNTDGLRGEKWAN